MQFSHSPAGWPNDVRNCTRHPLPRAEPNDLVTGHFSAMPKFFKHLGLHVHGLVAWQCLTGFFLSPASDTDTSHAIEIMGLPLRS